MADRVGQQLGNYRLIRLLGRGGFAEVYLGEHLRLGTQAAVKVLYTRLANPDDVMSFEKEARTIAHLKHLHIVRVLDYDVDDDTPFLVMDYAAGGTLRKRYPKGTILPLTKLISYVKQIADALQYAHDQHIIHRDIKPENMLIGERDEMLLSDFGIAIVAQSSRYESTQNLMGTMAYMAPEQIQGHPRPASDQYSFGIVVYEWLSGNRPFHGSMTEIVAQQLAAPPPSLHEKIPTISPEVEQVVLTALEKDPHKRFTNMRAFATTLEQASQTAISHPITRTSEAFTLSQHLPKTDTNIVIVPNQSPSSSNAVTFSRQSLQPTNMGSLPDQQPYLTVASAPSHTSTALPSSMGEPMLSAKSQPPKRYFSRRAVLVGLTGMTGLTMIGGGLIWLAHSQKSRVTFTKSPSLSRGTLLYTYRGHSYWVHSVAWSPDGNRVASGSGDRTVRIWDAASGNTILTYNGHSRSQYGVFSVAWSPNGKYLASSGDDQLVQVWDATNGNLLYTYLGFSKDVNGSVDAVAWSLDGKRIASGSWSKVVKVWDAFDGGNAYIYFNHFAGVDAVAWSPNGTRIASGGNDNRVQVWDAANGGNAYIYRGHSGDVSAVVWSHDGKRIASGSYDNTVQVWDAVDGGNAYIYRGPFTVINAVAWSPDGRWIAAGSADSTTFNSGVLQIWNAASGGNVVTYGDHSRVITALAWSRDSKRIASAGMDGTVQVWQVV